MSRSTLGCPFPHSTIGYEPPKERSANAPATKEAFAQYPEIFGLAFPVSIFNDAQKGPRTPSCGSQYLDPHCGISLNVTLGGDTRFVILGDPFALAVMLTTRLHRLLDEVRNAGGEHFSGVGVLVSDAPEDLPIMPLRPTLDFSDKRCTTKMLTEFSQFTSDYHDGFHVLSPDLLVLRFSVYFSPPIVHNVVAGQRHHAGGRYWAALFGSALPQVLAAGVASTRYGVAVFEAGREVRNP